jgi:hypothetical protein
MAGTPDPDRADRHQAGWMSRCAPTNPLADGPYRRRNSARGCDDRRTRIRCNSCPSCCYAPSCRAAAREPFEPFAAHRAQPKRRTVSPVAPTTIVAAETAVTVHAPSKRFGRDAGHPSHSDGAGRWVGQALQQMLSDPCGEVDLERHHLVWADRQFFRTRVTERHTPRRGPQVARSRVSSAALASMPPR